MGALARFAAVLTGLQLDAAPPPPAPTIPTCPSWPWAANPTGANLAPFTAPGFGLWGRDLAMSLPTIARARTLLTSQVARLPLDRWRLDAQGDPAVLLDALPWQLTPDPQRTRAHMLAWTVDDLMFHGFAYWHVSARYSDSGFPRWFERMPFDEVNVTTAGVRWGADDVDPGDVVQFEGIVPGILCHGSRAMGIALEQDAATLRFASAPVPAGWLEASPDMEQLGADQLDADGAAFEARRRTNVIAALQGYTYHESTMDPGRLQLVDAREYQALELARLADIPPYLVGAPAGTGMTYLNAQQAVSDLVTFGASPHITTIEQTLSQPWITPQGQAVRFRLPPDPTTIAQEATNAPGTDSTGDGGAPSGGTAPPDGGGTRGAVGADRPAA